MNNGQFAYVARKPCGCVSGTVHDNKDRRTGETVADFISEGWTVGRAIEPKPRAS